MVPVHASERDFTINFINLKHIEINLKKCTLGFEFSNAQLQVLKSFVFNNSYSGQSYSWQLNQLIANGKLAL